MGLGKKLAVRQEQRSRVGGYSDFLSFGGYGDNSYLGEGYVYSRSERILRLPVVWGCVRVRASRIASMRLTCEDKDAKLPVWMRMPESASARLGDRSPITISQFLFQTQASFDLYGNAFWGIQRDRSGRVQNIAVLNPDYINIPVNEIDGRWKIYYQGLLNLEIVVVPHIMPPGYPFGLPLISAHRVAFEASKEGQEHALSGFKNFSQVTGVLRSDGNMSDEEIKIMRRNWRLRHGGKNRTGQPAYIGSAHFTPISLSPQDAQYIQTRQYTDSQVAAMIFGVDPGLLNLPRIGNSMTYATIQSRETSVIVELQLAKRQIEDALSYLCGMKPIKLTPLNWTDSLTKAKVREANARTSVMLGATLESINEMRIEDGKEPIEGGDAMMLEKADTTAALESSKMADMKEQMEALEEANQTDNEDEGSDDEQ